MIHCPAQLVFIGLIVGLLFLCRSDRRLVGSRRRFAREYVRVRMEAWGRPWEIERVVFDEVPGLDAEFYFKTTWALAEHGFRLVADSENKTASRLLGQPLCSRDLWDEAHGTLASLASVRPRGGRPVRYVELRTELASGRWIVTVNSPRCDLPCTPTSQVDRRYLPPGTPLDRLLALHRDRVDVARRAGAVVVPSTTFEEATASDERLRRLVLADIETHGVVTRDDLRRILAPMPVSASDAYFEAVREEIRVRRES